MVTRIKILISTLILIAAAANNAIAQTDTLKNLPLYKNATADCDHNNKDKNEDSTQSTDIRSVINNKLRELQSLHAAGKYRDALQLSKDIDDKFTLNKAENLARLKYTLAANKDLDNDAEADNIAKIFIQKYPFYDPNTDADAPVSFKKVLKNYYAKPKYSIWAAAGIRKDKPYNATIRTIIDTSAKSKPQTPKYKIKGYMLQLGFEYRPLKIVSLSIAPSLTSYHIKRSIQRTTFATFHYDETSTVFSLPIFVEAGLYKKREIFVPSIYAGAEMKYIANSEYKAYTETIGTYTPPTPKTDTYTKTRLNYSLLGGIRLNYNRRRMTYFADFGISMDMLTYNDPKKIHSNPDLIYHNLYVPDVFRMAECTVKIGAKVNLQYKTIAKFKYGY